ncbi:MAG: tape measure protein, partial [Novosphingobium sp.]
MADKKDLKVTLSLLDKATAPLNAFNKKLEGIQAPLRTLNNKMSMLGQASGLGRLTAGFNRVRGAAGGVIDQVSRLGGMLGLAGGGAIFAFKKGFIDVAAEFEKFETVLTTIEGSSEKARQSMGWISNFAAKTPYELTEVTESFVKLRAYGMEPTNGLLKTLGDTSAAMGKPLMQAVEAVADAMTGENERLKEFGIRASKVGNKIVYEYSHNGKTIRAAAQAGNRAQIQATLEAIWNQKYAGAMDKLSGTWGGMMSNLSDQWTRFADMVMKSGPFENLKGRLSSLLAEIDRMAESGELQKLADVWGKKITDGLNAAYQAGVKVFNFFRGFIDTVGGLENALLLVVAAMGAPLLAAFASLTAAFVSLGAAIGFTPVGWFLAAVALIAGAAYLIYKNWEPITKWLQLLWDDPLKALDQAWEWCKETFSWSPLALIVQHWEPIRDWFKGLWKDITDLFDKGVENVKKALSKINPADAASKAWNSAKSFLGFGDDEDGAGQASAAAAGIGLGALAGAASAAQAGLAAQVGRTITNTN